MNNTTAKIGALVNSSDVRMEIYKRARVVLPKIGARCATTQSLLLIHAGVMNGIRLGTDGLRDALTQRYWARTSMIEKLQSYDMLFSEDRAGRHGGGKTWDQCVPDHVYLFIRWEQRDKQLAVIWDNNAVGFTLRNLGAACWHKGRRYNRTPFMFALRPPN